MATGTAKVNLVELSPDQTQLSYSVDVALAGRLGQIGGRLIEGASRKLSGEFFNSFREMLSGARSAAPEIAPTNAAAATANSAGKLIAAAVLIALAIAVWIAFF